MRLSRQSFRDVIKHTPLVSIDFTISNGNGHYLLGLRENAPAKGFWFNVGGRIFKNETIADAQARIFKEELNWALPEAPLRLIGVFDHIYHDNVFGDPDYGTHYVCMTYAVSVDFTNYPERDAQHSCYRWIGRDALLASDEVHPNTKIAFV